MNRKKFLERISVLTAGGMMSAAFLGTACSTNTDNSASNISFGTDTLSSPKDTLHISDSLNHDLMGIPAKDTLESKYSTPLMDDYARARYCDIVGQNAEKIFPQCKPYLELILKSNHDYRHIFDIPPEYNIAMLNRESNFDPNALSSVGALGIAQFMRNTAIDAGLKVYDGRKYKELYDSEKRLRELGRNIAVLWNDNIIPSLRKNDFKSVESLKKEYDSVVTEHGKLKNTVHKIYLEELPHMEDARLIWQEEIPASVKDYAHLADKCQKFFGGKHIHNIIRGAAAYNCGYDEVENWKGLPLIQETIWYVRDIMVNSDKMAPQLSKNVIYEANPQIVAELVAGKVYTLNSQANLK
jgi:hypothetical protein